MSLLLRKSSAWIPIALTALILSIMAVHLSVYGAVRETDEGTVAHLFQIWIVLEVLTIGFFAFTSIPRAPRNALLVLALQIACALVPLAIVHSLQL